jgi:hypothetical protein
MTSTRFVRPAIGVEGRPLSVVKEPSHLKQCVAAEGEELPVDAWLLRRIADGDLVDATPAAAEVKSDKPRASRGAASNTPATAGES